MVVVLVVVRRGGGRSSSCAVARGARRAAGDFVEHGRGQVGSVLAGHEVLAPVQRAAALEVEEEGLLDGDGGTD